MIDRPPSPNRAPIRCEAKIASGGYRKPGVGTNTCDANGCRFWSDTPPPCGFRLSKISIISKPGKGIVGRFNVDLSLEQIAKIFTWSLKHTRAGLALVASGGGRQHEIGMRGQCFVGITETFELKPEEQLVKVEVVAGEVLERMRFFTSRGRVSSWLGEQNLSIAPQLIHLKTHHGISQDPLCSYIIGFHGTESTARLLSIGIIIRSVKRQHIFSYDWIGKESMNVAQEPSTRVKDTGEKMLSDVAVEFSNLVRLRSQDLKRALNRSLKLAKRLWRLPCDKSHSCLSKHRIVIHLARWIFEALARRLPNLAKEDKKQNNGRVNFGIEVSNKVKDYYSRLIQKARQEERLNKLRLCERSNKTVTSNMMFLPMESQELRPISK